MNNVRRSICLLTLILVLAASLLAHAASYQYIRIGNKDNIKTNPAAGVAMRGASRWTHRCSRSGCLRFRRNWR